MAQAYTEKRKISLVYNNRNPPKRVQQDNCWPYITLDGSKRNHVNIAPKYTEDEEWERIL